MILVIICKYARDQGKQYSERLLPEFLTPHSVIRVDYLQEAAALPREEQTPDRVSGILVCIDPKTARRYLSKLYDAFEVPWSSLMRAAASAATLPTRAMYTGSRQLLEPTAAQK